MSSSHSQEVRNDQGNPVEVTGTVVITPSGVQDVNIVSTITLPVSGTVDIGTMPEVEIKNDVGNPVPISGTVTANQGTANTVANSWPIKLTDGTDTASVNTDGSINVFEVRESQIPVLFTSTMSKTGIGTTELMTIFLKNPSGSGKTLYLKDAVVTNTHTVANSWVRWRMYVNPTTSADGTALTENPLGIGSGNVAVATAFNTPTVTVQGAQLADTVVLAGDTKHFVFPVGSYILQNNTLLITAVADAAARVGQVTLIWSEL